MNRTFTAEQLHMLSGIFRIIVKEIKTNEDKELLAPGELGINYLDGSFYIKNPNTGELFSPNSVETIKPILTNWDATTHKLNADTVSYIKFYSNLGQLSQLGVSLSMDSVIRQMESPSILMSKVEYENFSVLGFPSNSGTVLINKVNEEFVICSYFDNNNYTTYNGRYNKFKHLFEGWAISGTTESPYVETTGTADLVTITIDKQIKDLDVLTARLTRDINPGATLSVNGSDYLPIVYTNGEPIDATVFSNNIIILIYDEQKKCWILDYSNNSALARIVKMISERTSETENKLNETIKNYDKKILDIQNYIAILEAKPGKIITYASTYSPKSNDTDTINNIDNFDASIDKLVVNFNQTILREDIDYVITTAYNGIQLINNIKLNSTDILQFIVVKQAK